MAKSGRQTLQAFGNHEASENLKAKQTLAKTPGPSVAPTPAGQNNENETPEEKQARIKKEFIDNKKKELKNRRAQKDSAIRAIPHTGHGDGGSIGKAEHLAGLTAEGVAGEMIAHLMIFAIEATFNTPFWIQAEQFNEALRQELASLEGGNKPLRLCYLPDDNGDYPAIYPTNSQGEVDFEADPLPEHEITPFAIRANGYIPMPSITEAYQIVLDKHFERMLGAGVLSPEQKARMTNTLAEMQGQKKEGNDLASDATSIKAAQPQPRPKL
jgi:hypothetical protein